ncbi:zinc finger and SCAN domain-containing protein 2 [Helicoverpa armigera]|uniref:zinc finger and SCAN domain-containing protein 2 n=1 Tax=Helicoverpa armigera TaxID=29058 RepID=UPI003082AB14
MEDLLACRVCLATSVNLYDMYKYRLKNLFELFSGIQVSPADNFPQYLCSYCGALLLKCAAFRDRCKRANDLMKNAELQNEILTTDQIHTIALLNNTELPLTISTPELTNTQEIQVKIEHLTADIYKEEIDLDFSDEEPLANKVRKKKDDSDIEILSLDTNFSTIDERSDLGSRIDEDSQTVDDQSNDTQENDDQNDEQINDMPSVQSEFEELSDVDEKSDKDQTEADNVIEECTCGDIEVKSLTKEEQIKEVQDRKTSHNYTHSCYKCEYCYKGFLQDTTYKNHMLRHDKSSGSLHCDVCNTWWRTLRNLKSHITNAHERVFICKICTQTTKSAHRAKEHIKWHKGHKFTCKLCGATFAKSTSHLTHLRLHHPSKYCCEVCGESFLGEVGLAMHIKKSHRCENVSHLTHLRLHHPSKYCCEVCGESFLGEVGLAMHIKKSHRCENANPETEFKCEKCSIYFKTMEALKMHKSAYKDGVCDGSQNSCFQCGENVPTQDALKDHLKTHEPGGVKCDECDRIFAHDRSFAIHYQRVHLGIKNKQRKPKDKRKRTACVCEFCGKKCDCIATLISHQRTHTGEKPFQCIECPKRFSQIQRLRIHVRTHTGERPFKCTVCPKAFKHKAALNRHDRVHSGEKPYQCARCGKNFSQSNSMKLHVRTVHLKLPAPYRARRDTTIDCLLETTLLN